MDPARAVCRRSCSRWAAIEKHTMRKTLDALLDESEPVGSFHDALLLSVRVDFQAATLVAEMSLVVGSSDESDGASTTRRRNGRLILRKLRHYSLEPSFVERTRADGPLWLTSDGPIEESPTETGKALAASLKDCFAAWLYFSNLNAFAYCASEEATFEWL